MLETERNSVAVWGDSVSRKDVSFSGCKGDWQQRRKETNTHQTPAVCQSWARRANAWCQVEHHEGKEQGQPEILKIQKMGERRKQIFKRLGSKEQVDRRTLENNTFWDEKHKMFRWRLNLIGHIQGGKIHKEGFCLLLSVLCSWSENGECISREMGSERVGKGDASDGEDCRMNREYNSV